MIALFCKWLFWIVGAALLGFLLAWLMRGAKAYEWQTKLQDKEGSYNLLKNRHNSSLSKYEALEGNFRTLKSKNNDLEKNLVSFEKKASKLEKQLSLVPAPSTAAAVAPVVATNTVKVVDNSYEVQTWKTKHARLERDLTTMERELVKTQEENESLFTKMEVLELTAAEAKEDKVKALSKLTQHEAYKSRFEDANLERNTLKFKYEQLLTTKGTISEDIESLEIKNQVMASELEDAKKTATKAVAQASEWRTKLEELDNKTSSHSKKYEEIKVKYDSMLGLQERTEEKMKALSAAIPSPEQIEELAEYRSINKNLRKDNVTLREALEKLQAAQIKSDS